MQVFWQDLRVGAPFVHWRGILGDLEPQQARLIPHLNRLDKRPSGEFAISHRPWAGSIDNRPAVFTTRTRRLPVSAK